MTLVGVGTWECWRADLEVDDIVNVGNEDDIEQTAKTLADVTFDDLTSSISHAQPGKQTQLHTSYHMAKWFGQAAADEPVLAHLRLVS